MDYEQFRFNQPKRVLQTVEDLDACTLAKQCYSIQWTGPNSMFGVFRVKPLNNNLADSKNGIMRILKASYPTVKFRSFQDVIDFCKTVGIEIVLREKDNYTWIVEK